MRVICGIDPGYTGAVAFYWPAHDRLAVFDMPLGPDRQIDRSDLGSIFKAMTDGDELTTFVEKVHSMPRQGVSSSFNFGRSHGIALMAPEVVGCTAIDVTPQTWKKHFGLIKKPKDAARELALKRFPEYSRLFARKKDIGRADAALIALFGAENDLGSNL